jgi:hypothetical protein
MIHGTTNAYPARASRRARLIFWKDGKDMKTPRYLSRKHREEINSLCVSVVS